MTSKSRGKSSVFFFGTLFNDKDNEHNDNNDNDNNNGNAIDNDNKKVWRNRKLSGKMVANFWLSISEFLKGEKFHFI